MQVIWIGQHNGFIARIKEVAPHINAIHCIIHRQHFAARDLGGEMSNALKVAINMINVVQVNSLHERGYSSKYVKKNTSDH